MIAYNHYHDVSHETGFIYCLSQQSSDSTKRIACHQPLNLSKPTAEKHYRNTQSINGKSIQSVEPIGDWENCINFG